ncbi:MAG: hypothetical protein WDZ59_07205 [Pirellulales bacterium]
MRFHRGWKLALPTLIALLTAVPAARAQYGAQPPGNYAAPSVMTDPRMVPAGYGAAGYGAAGGGEWGSYDPSAACPPGVVPAGHGHRQLAGPGYAMGYGYDWLPEYGDTTMGGHPDLDGDGSCDTCAAGGRGGIGQFAGPYYDGTCGPRWFDAHVEAMYLKRENVGRQVNFTSDGAAGLGEPLIVLSTDDLGFDDEPGFRLTLRHEVGPASVIEGSYFGTFHWDSVASVASSTDNLFSVFSDFGGPVLFPGFSDTDQAFFHSIEYTSELHSVELNWRRDWMSSTWRTYGSFLMGARYVQLSEDFRHLTRTDTGSMNYLVETENDLAGFQVGGDAYFCVFPGLTFGGEVKAGVYNNSADQSTVVRATSLDPALVETEGSDDVAMVAEGGAIVVYQVSPSFSLRGGYQFVYIDGVALAPENFNGEPPFLGGPRDVFINDNGDAFYHGPTAGLEWMW